jgi:hypothetical protein
MKLSPSTGEVGDSYSVESQKDPTEVTGHFLKEPTDQVLPFPERRTERASVASYC